MSDDVLPSNMSEWQEGDTPVLTVTLLDSAGAAIPLANVLTLKLTQWIAQDRGLPGITINSRNLQDVKNAHDVTIHATSGLVSWGLTTSDTAFQNKDTTVLEERHEFRFDLLFNASGVATSKSYVDNYLIQRKQAVK